ncbi:MAG TPA: ABC transporter ATP-binding protein [Alphaproteobacteria bacterium]|nr:ABC transporter ATP-binding protein [Alphaproteobacteria bacterium]
MDTPLLQAENVQKTFHQGGEILTVLHNVTLSIAPGEIVALVGPSGAGKSTLLQIIGLLDTPSAGRVRIAGREASAAGDDVRTRLRREHIGFVYQFHYLQPEFSALENVVIPQMIAGRSRGFAQKHAAALLTEMGLEARLDHRPARLSGGEQQRVAIARALANDPSLVLADEPTGNLDPRTAQGVFDLLLARVRGAGLGALIATHNMDLADQMDRILELRAGRIMSL